MLATASVYPSVGNKTIQIYETTETYYKVDFRNDSEVFNFWMKNEVFSLFKPDFTLANYTIKKITFNFKFLFYGHSYDTIYVTTSGFLYISDFLHRFMAFSQYIAPFMADLEMKQNNGVKILYQSKDNLIQIIWKNMILKSDIDGKKYGNITFSVVILKNGTIIFLYDKVPQDILSNVIIGLSDAYYMDFEKLNIRRIVLYSRITVVKLIHSKTMIYFTPKQLCHQIDSCKKCQLANPDMKCQWCSALKRCSNGFDRFRQSWLNEKCHEKTQLTIEACDIFTPGVFTAIIVIMILLIIVTLSVVIVICYKHCNNPNSRFGRFLIKNRPSNIRSRLPKIKFRRDTPYHVTFQ